MRSERVGNGKVIEALARLVDAANLLASEGEPDKYDHWRALVMAARRDHDAICDEVRRLRALAHGEEPGAAPVAPDAAAPAAITWTPMPANGPGHLGRCVCGATWGFVRDRPYQAAIEIAHEPVCPGPHPAEQGPSKEGA